MREIKVKKEKSNHFAKEILLSILFVCHYWNNTYNDSNRFSFEILLGHTSKFHSYNSHLFYQTLSYDRKLYFVPHTL
jgi:hypothetical protein